MTRFDPWRACGFLLCAQLFFTLLDAGGKALADDMGIPLLALVRHAGQVLVMAVLLGPRMGRDLWQTGHWPLQVARGIVLGAFTLCFFSALRHLPQAEATAINFIAPFIVMLLAGPLLGEQVGAGAWIGATVGFAGMLLIVRPGHALEPLGVTFALLTVVCNVAFQLLTRRLASLERAVPTIFVSALVGVILSAAMLPWQDRWGGWPGALTPGEIGLLCVLGSIGAVSQWLFIRAYYWSSASFIAPLVYLQMAWAVGSGWMFFGQFPDGVTLAGMGIILAGGAIAVWARPRWTLKEGNA
ncbi:MAG: DMT family transporter [Gammaproteobacteria bacterium]